MSFRNQTGLEIPFGSKKKLLLDYGAIVNVKWSISSVMKRRLETRELLFTQRIPENDMNRKCEQGRGYNEVRDWV